MSQSSSPISKKCKIVSGASRQSLSVHDLHSSAWTFAPWNGCQSSHPAAPNLSGQRTDSVQMKGRQFRKEWKITFPWLVARDGKCFATCARGWQEVNAGLLLTSFLPIHRNWVSNWKKALSGVMKSDEKHSAGSFQKHMRSEAHAKALVAFTTSQQGMILLACSARHSRRQRSREEPLWLQYQWLSMWRVTRVGLLRSLNSRTG